MSRWRELTDSEKERYRQITHRCHCLRPTLNPDMTPEFLATVAFPRSLDLFEKLLDRIDQMHEWEAAAND